MRNDYLPIPVEISRVRFETADKLIKTFDLTFLNPEDEEPPINQTAPGPMPQSLRGCLKA